MVCDSRLVFAAGMAICLVASLIFVIYSAMLIGPYDYTKNFESVTCTVLSSSYIGNVCCLSLTYDGVCSQPYPCLQVAVSYTVSGETIPAQVYKDYEAAVYQGENGSVSTG